MHVADGVHPAAGSEVMGYPDLTRKVESCLYGALEEKQPSDTLKSVGGLFCLRVGCCIMMTIMEKKERRNFEA